MQLRPYQIDGMTLIQESFRKGHKRVIRTAPTGSGKSIEMSEMTRRAFEKNKRVIILTHRMELFKSTLKHLGRSGIPCVELNAGSDIPMGDWKVMLAMEKTLWNRITKDPSAILPPSLLIADEIHFQNFSKIIEHYSDAFLIGFSATPQGKHIHKIYTDIIQNIDIPELIRDGFLVPCKPFQMVDNFDDVKISKGEFEDKSLFQHFNKPKLYEGIIEEYRDKCAGLKGIVFCVNVEHTIATHKAFTDAGYTAYMVHSKMKEAERISQIQAFETDPLGVMINCGILTTGYDCPSIQAVVVYRATTSLPLWLQMQGRGSRPYPGKERFIVLDFGMNHNRLGLWNQPRTWSIKEPKKKKKEQAAPVKTCPSCGAMIYATVRTCEYCNYEFPKPTHTLREGIMCEVDTDIPLGLSGKRISDLSLNDLLNCQRTKKIKPSYVWRVLRTKQKEADDKKQFIELGEVASVPAEINVISDYAKLAGYKFGWVMSQKRKMEEEGQTGFRDYIIK